MTSGAGRPLYPAHEMRNSSRRLLACDDCLPWASVATTGCGKLIRRPFVYPPDRDFRLQEAAMEMMRENGMAMARVVSHAKRDSLEK
jgi:hypothetical protein